MISLAELSHEIDHIEPIPISQPRLAEVVADPNADLQQIVSVIEYDPALTANTLKMANSAFYSNGVSVPTVREAVRRLGAGRILQNVVGHELRSRIVMAFPGYNLDENELWRHSVAAAVAADSLPRVAKVPISPIVFTAALLHDLGKLVLSQHLAGDLKEEILYIANVHNKPYVEAERVVLGFDHAQVGGVIARRWHFPEVLADAIARHHHPRQTSMDPILLDAVHVSNAVAKIIGVGFGTEEMNMLADSAAAREIGLTPATLESLCASVAQDLPRVIALFEDENNGL